MDRGTRIHDFGVTEFWIIRSMIQASMGSGVRHTVAYQFRCKTSLDYPLWKQNAYVAFTRLPIISAPDASLPYQISQQTVRHVCPRLTS